MFIQYFEQEVSTRSCNLERVAKTNCLLTSPLPVTDLGEPIIIYLSNKICTLCPDFGFSYTILLYYFFTLNVEFSITQRILL